MDLDFSILPRFQNALLIGLWVTIKLTLVCGVLGLALGFLLALARSARSALIRGAAGLYVDFFRGTPVLIQIFWVFFCLPLVLQTEIPNFLSAVIALTLYMGAITSETFRAALRSIGPEQMDACVALGLPATVKAWHVVLPQALLRAIPVLLSNGIGLFKESALISTVGIADLMFVGNNISNNTARPVEVLTAVALIYFVIAFPLTRVVGALETRVLKKLEI
ncbi:amino acid ABC transporter permease [Castellaniella hirudinis]|uniref:amino acid ABC transporter permease n=1 Tax=Castellaniella hirudinis TaxID=1144617 RepID=UPI0039C20250